MHSVLKLLPGSAYQPIHRPTFPPFIGTLSSQRFAANWTYRRCYVLCLPMHPALLVAICIEADIKFQRNTML